jgi:hypothetical protein
MASKTLTQEKAPQVKSSSQSTTRLLLALWELGVDKKAFAKGELPDRAKTPGNVFKQLVDDGAIKVEKQKTQTMVSLEEKGVERLTKELESVDFELKGTTTGAWLARGLLKWLQQMDTAVSVNTTNGKVAKETIASYDEFKPKVLAIFEKLDKGYNYSGLVPIWHIRRELGDRVDRVEFSDWMMEMQTENELYLQTGEARQATEDQKRDSISNEIRGLLFFASQES